MKVLLVTGSSRGIGAEICRQAASGGWKVCINYAHSEDEADRLVADIRAAEGIAIAVQADVSDEDAVVHLFERIDRIDRANLSQNSLLKWLRHLLFPS